MKDAAKKTPRKSDLLSREDVFEKNIFAQKFNCKNAAASCARRELFDLSANCAKESSTFTKFLSSLSSFQKKRKRERES